MDPQAANMSGMPGEGRQSSSELYNQARQAVSDAYCKTAQTVTQTYDQMMNYGRENPGKMTLMAFGVGVGVGLVIAAASPRRERIKQYATPLIGVLSKLAMDFVRGR